MTNSDSRTKFSPGDRVRIKLSPRYVHSYSAEENQTRAALAGKEVTIRERTVTNAYRVAPPGSVERGAWFEADELGPVEPLDVLDAAVQQALAQARREAAGWHSAALLARGEAAEARQEAKRLAGDLAYIRAERDALRSEADALRGKLGAANAEVEEAVAVLHREREVRQATEERLAAECSAHEASALGAVKLARRLADVGAAWGRMRAFLLALPRPLGAAGIEGVDAVDKALGGVAVAKVAGPWRWWRGR